MQDTLYFAAGAGFAAQGHWIAPSLPGEGREFIVLFGTALIAGAAIALHIVLGGAAPNSTLPAGLPASQLFIFLPAIYLSNIFLGGPIAEGFGWRGFALPRLQARIGALNAAIVIGVFLAFWHLPFFLFPEGTSVVGNIPFVWYLPLLIAWSVLFAWIYNNTNGSVLMMILFHASINTTLGTLGLLRIASEGVRPLLLNIALTWIAVAIITLIFGSGRLAQRHPGPGLENKATGLSTPVEK